MKKVSLKKFNELYDHLLSEQVKATINGKQMDVKDDGNGNIEISGELPADSDNITDQQIQSVSLENKLEAILQFLRVQLEQNINASRAAKIYASHAKDDLPKVMYNQGYAEGKKHIIKYLIKELTGLLNNE